MMMAHSYTTVLLLKGELFHRMVAHLDLYITPINRSKFTRTIIPQKLKKAETDVSSLIDGVHCVVISYDLWMSNMTQVMFSMTKNYTRDYVRDNAQIGIPITTATDGIVYPVGNVIN